MFTCDVITRKQTKTLKLQFTSLCFILKTKSYDPH